MPDIEFPSNGNNGSNNGHGSNAGTGSVLVEEARPAYFPPPAGEAPAPPTDETPEVKPAITGGQKKPSKLVVFGIGAVVLIGLFALMFHHPAKKPVASQKQPEPTQATPAAPEAQSQTSLLTRRTKASSNSSISRTQPLMRFSAPATLTGTVRLSIRCRTSGRISPARTDNGPRRPILVVLGLQMMARS